MSERIATEIEVEVIDLQHVLDYVYKTYKEQRSNVKGSESYDHRYDDVIGFSLHYAPFARFITRDRNDRRFYLLNTDGQIQPVSNSEPSHWPVYKEYRPECDIMEGMPSTQVTIFPEDVRIAPVLEVKNLADFVRSFGGSVEARYDHCRVLLEGTE